MSSTAAHTSKHVRRACERCRQRKARFRYLGRVRADRHHTLCFACYRAERERRRATLLFDLPTPRPLSFPFESSGAGATSARQLAHRRRMLDWLEAAAAPRRGPASR